MLSFLSCVGCRYFRFAPFASISFASHRTVRTWIAQNHVSFTNARLCFAQAPWFTFEIHMKTIKDIMKTWRRHVLCRPYTESQIRAQPSPARPPEPNPAPNPAQCAKHGQIPRPTQPSVAEPNPCPTRPSAPSTAKSAPNTAQRAHQRVQSLFSKIEPHR